MAKKRMFRLDVIETDAFMDMPLTTQALYFHLNMRADDDGFIGNPKLIVRMIGASNDDLNILISKRFLLQFESGIVVVKHWRMHNTISGSRYYETKYLEEKSMLRIKDNKAYTFSENGREIDDSRIVEMFDRNNGRTLEEHLENDGRILEEHLESADKIRLDKNRLKEKVSPTEIPKRKPEIEIPYEDIVRDFNNTCKSLPQVRSLSDERRKAIKARIRTRGIEEIHKAFQMVEESDFLKGANNKNWSATFDWVMKDANMSKILDGNYKNKSPTPKAPAHNFQERDYDFDDLERRFAKN